jgi:hypothetical protein
MRRDNHGRLLRLVEHVTVRVDEDLGRLGVFFTPETVRFGRRLGAKAKHQIRRVACSPLFRAKESIVASDDRLASFSIPQR